MDAVDMLSVTENLMIFFGCAFKDQNGTATYSEDVLIVNKSTGIIYSFGEDAYPYPFEYGFGAPRNNIYAQKNPTSFLMSSPTDKLLYSVEIIGDEAVLKQLISTSAPIFGNGWRDCQNLFALSGDKVGLSVNNIQSTGMASIVYPNGGYEKFDNGNFVLLDNSILAFTPTDNTIDCTYNCEWIHLGSQYGQSTRENLELPEELANNDAFNITSWFENDKNVLIAYSDSYTSKQQRFMTLNKATKKFDGLSTEFSGTTDFELWKENLDDDRFYGLIRNDAGEISAICWLNPENYDHGETPLNLSDIDISTIETDYRHGSMQLIGTRRSDGYKVAVNVDLRNGTYTTLFSDPNLTIQTLLRLN